jgi:hypothetical protein
MGEVMRESMREFIDRVMRRIFWEKPRLRQYLIDCLDDAGRNASGGTTALNPGEAIDNVVSLMNNEYGGKFRPVRIFVSGWINIRMHELPSNMWSNK